VVDLADSRPLHTRPIFEAWERHDVEFVLVGGLAARVHGATRVTKDMDICPA
jgi:hypothetical protein